LRQWQSRHPEIPWAFPVSDNSKVAGLQVLWEAPLLEGFVLETQIEVFQPVLNHYSGWPLFSEFYRQKSKSAKNK
ncbi:MAG TPA: hypothetical protein DCY95_19410, partial [Algoriphagus sp.]|nr:hypothetical protein [Algoriphagus sp.]